MYKDNKKFKIESYPTQHCWMSTAGMQLEQL